MLGVKLNPSTPIQVPLEQGRPSFEAFKAARHNLEGLGLETQEVLKSLYEKRALNGQSGRLSVTTFRELARLAYHSSDPELTDLARGAKPFVPALHFALELDLHNLGRDERSAVDQGEINGAIGRLREFRVHRGDPYIANRVLPYALSQREDPVSKRRSERAGRVLAGINDEGILSRLRACLGEVIHQNGTAGLRPPLGMFAALVGTQDTDARAQLVLLLSGGSPTLHPYAARAFAGSTLKQEEWKGLSSIILKQSAPAEARLEAACAVQTHLKTRQEESDAWLPVITNHSRYAINIALATIEKVQLGFVERLKAVSEAGQLTRLYIAVALWQVDKESAHQVLKGAATHESVKVKQQAEQALTRVGVRLEF